MSRSQIRAVNIGRSKTRDEKGRIMNILHISPYFPSMNANHAGGVCMGKQIEELRKHHNVYVLTFVASEFDKKLQASYESDGRYGSVTINRWTRLFHIATEPWMPAYFAARSSFRFAVKLIQTVRKCNIDVIHAEYASMGQYMWIKKLFPHLKFNLTEHDMTAQSYERKLQDLHGIRKLVVALQLKLVLRQERRYCQKADTVFTFNQKDQKLIATRYNRPDCLVLNPYYGIEDELLEETLNLDMKQSGNICFLGQMGREENAQAAMRLISIAERLKPKFPELQVYIVGNQPPEELKCRDNDYIHVTVQPHFRFAPVRSRAFVKNAGSPKQRAG